MEKILSGMILAAMLAATPAFAQGSRCLEFQVDAMTNDFWKTAEFLDAGVDINCRDPVDSNHTALMKAAGNGSVGTVTLLLSHGAQTNLRNDEGETALGEAQFMHKAASEGGENLAYFRGRLETVIDMLKMAHEAD